MNIVDELKDAKSKIEKGERQEARRIIKDVRHDIIRGVFSSELEMAKLDVKLGRTRILEDIISKLEEDFYDSRISDCDGIQNRRIFDIYNDICIEWPTVGRDLHNTKSIDSIESPISEEYNPISETLVRDVISENPSGNNNEEDREQWEFLPNHSPVPSLTNSLKIGEQWMKSSSPIVHYGEIFVGTNKGNVHRIGFDGSIRETYELPAEVIASPAIRGDVLIVGTFDNSLHGISIETGNEIWSIETEGSIFGSPVIIGDIVYVGDIGGQVHAINYVRGKEVWSIGLDNAVVTRPALAENILVFGGLGVGDPMGQDRGGPFATNKNYLYAVDRKEGDILWKQKEHGNITDPVVIDEAICIGTQSGILRLTGIEDGSQKGEMSLESGIVGSPAVDDGELTVGCLDGSVHRLIPGTNEKIWKFETDGSILSPPAIHGTTGVIASEYDGVYIFDTRTGDVVQYFELDDRQRSAPAFTGNGFVLQNAIFQKKTNSNLSTGNRAVDDAERVAEEVNSESFNGDDVSNAELIPQAAQLATADDEEVRYLGAKALSHLFQTKGKDRLELINALDRQEFENNQSLLEAIIQTSVNNLGKEVRGDIRGRAALTIGYIASKRPERIAINQVLDELVDLLENGGRRVRRRRATFALTYLAYYDAPDSESVREQLAKVVDSINELAANEEKRKTQSVGLRALGFVALSYPDAVAPANPLIEAVTNENLRPRNRNRALRSLWKLALSRPDIAEKHLNAVIDLLSYNTEKASDTDYIDGDDIEKHARWVRSNAAKTIAVVAAESPHSVDEEAINELVGLIESDDYADYRAILALGELSEEYVDRIIKSGGHEAVQNVLSNRDGRHVDDLSEREVTKCGYAGWTLLKINTKTPIGWGPTCKIVDLLFSVPNSEKTQFHRRRVEGIEILSSGNPTLLDYDRVESYLTEREQNSTDPTEQELIKVAQDQLQTVQPESEQKEDTNQNYPEVPRLQQIDTGETISVKKVDDYKPSHSSDIFEVALSSHGKEKPAWLKVVRAGYDPENRVATNFAHTTELWNEIDNHENIVSILAWGTESQPWVATELLSYNLDTLITPGGINVNKALWIGERLADALQHAHNRGVVHFDLKPENVVFEYRSGDDWNQPKITDWQFAKRVADISGSLRDYDEHYAAPEIRDSDWGPVNQRADLYHLGEILYEMLTGEKWSQYARPPESHRTEVSSEVGSLVMELLVRRVGNRPETAAEVREQLRTLRDGTESDSPTSETTTAVATIEPPLSQIDYLKELRDDSARACLQQAKDVNRKVESHDLSDQAYQELCGLLADLIYELNERPNPDSGIREGTELYRLIDDIQDTAQSVYRDYIKVDSFFNK